LDKYRTNLALPEFFLSRAIKNVRGAFEKTPENGWWIVHTCFATWTSPPKTKF